MSIQLGPIAPDFDQDSTEGWIPFHRASTGLGGMA